jgi:hypothetical protein
MGANYRSAQVAICAVSDHRPRRAWGANCSGAALALRGLLPEQCWAETD